MRSFFSHIHHVLFDASYAREMVRFGGGVAAIFVVQVVAAAAAVEALTHTLALLDRQTGVAAILPRVLPGMEIRDGKLDPGRATPFVANSVDVGALLMLVGQTAPLGMTQPDSFLVVDTSAGAAIAQGSSVSVLLARDRLVLNLGGRMTLPVRYESLLGEAGDFAFSREFLEARMARSLGSIIAQLLMIHVVRAALAIGSALLFLALAAYIFRANRLGIPLVICLKLACFSILPMAIGQIVSAATGLRGEWLWHVAVFLSAGLLFRSVYVLQRDAANANGADRHREL